jgi:hypothetical protein
MQDKNWLIQYLSICLLVVIINTIPIIMTIKLHKSLFVLLAFSFILLNNACKKEDKDDREIFYFSDYFPLEEGNFWIYRTYRVNRNGQVESIRSFHDSIYIKGDTRPLHG